MDPPVKKKPRKRAPSYIRLGAGVILKSEDVYIEAFGGTLGKQGFRKLLRNLSIPTFQLKRTRYVDSLRFEMAMTASLRYGQKNLVAPGRDGHRTPPWTDRPDPGHIIKNYRKLAAELMLAKRVHGVRMTRDTREGIKKVANLLMESQLHMLPVKAQEDFERRALEDAGLDS